MFLKKKKEKRKIILAAWKYLQAHAIQMTAHILFAVNVGYLHWCYSDSATALQQSAEMLHETKCNVQLDQWRQQTCRHCFVFHEGSDSFSEDVSTTINVCCQLELCENK